MQHKVSHPFYSSKKWLKCRAAYISSKHYACEICGKPADVVHHKDPLHGIDYYDNPKKCFGYNNLMCLCHTCHNNIHHGGQAIAPGYYVDMQTGEIKALIPPQGGDEKSGTESR